MNEAKVSELQKRIFLRDDEIRAALISARLPLNDPITLLALMTLVHTVVSEMTLIGEAAAERLQEILTDGASGQRKKEEIH